MSNSWVRRIAQQERECASCWDRIFVGAEYFLVLLEGAYQRYCIDCEPEDEGCDL